MACHAPCTCHAPSVLLPAEAPRSGLEHLRDAGCAGQEEAPTGGFKVLHSRPLTPLDTDNMSALGAGKLQLERERGSAAARLRLKDLDAVKAAEADIAQGCDYFVLAAQAALACLLLVGARSACCVVPACPVCCGVQAALGLRLICAGCTGRPGLPAAGAATLCLLGCASTLCLLR